ncbi:hypothetical protein LTR08_003143 [Meristemomyces frigidus]|nr:hypothetical protein LTR08_003143 [Meristemomyces frigidus]
MGLQMPLKRKAIIVAAFGLRMIVIIPIVMHLHYVSAQIGSSNPTLAAANTTIWAEVEMHLCIIACICYCFRSFTAAVSTNYGSVAINLEVYDTVNGPSGYVPSKVGKGSGASASNNGETSMKSPFSGPNRNNNRKSITGGSKVKGAPKTTASDEVIILEEVRVESRQVARDDSGRTISDLSGREELDY